MAKPKIEFWMYVKCKTPDCDCRILLDKVGDPLECRYPLKALPPNALGTDWKETCPKCSVVHTYGKHDVLFSDAIDVSQIPAGPPSSAFRQAWGSEADAMKVAAAKKHEAFMDRLAAKLAPQLEGHVHFNVPLKDNVILQVANEVFQKAARRKVN